MEDKLIPLKDMKAYVEGISKAFDGAYNEERWLNVGFIIVDALEYIQQKETE